MITLSLIATLFSVYGLHFHINTHIHIRNNENNFSEIIFGAILFISLASIASACIGMKTYKKAYKIVTEEPRHFIVSGDMNRSSFSRLPVNSIMGGSVWPLQSDGPTPLAEFKSTWFQNSTSPWYAFLPQIGFQATNEVAAVYGTLDKDATIVVVTANGILIGKVNRAYSLH